jgi:hypothetical protein
MRAELRFEGLVPEDLKPNPVTGHRLNVGIPDQLRLVSVWQHAVEIHVVVV